MKIKETQDTSSEDAECLKPAKRLRSSESPTTREDSEMNRQDLNLSKHKNIQKLNYNDVLEKLPQT